jgi:hypothetical protein
MALFNFFSDPALKARQDQLDADWNSAWAVVQTCDNVPASSFSGFSTDRINWKQFYDSGSDWSSDSNNATNEWQARLKTWTDQFRQWGCTGNFSLTPGTVGADDPTPENNGIPAVKTPPPDTKSILEQAKDAVGKAGQGLWSDISFIGYAILATVLLVVFGLIYVLTHAKVSAPGVGSIG